MFLISKVSSKFVIDNNNGEISFPRLSEICFSVLYQAFERFMSSITTGELLMFNLLYFLNDDTQQARCKNYSVS